MMSKGSDAGGGRESQDRNRRVGGYGQRQGVGMERAGVKTATEGREGVDGGGAWEDVRVGTETGCREAGRSGHDDDTLSLGMGCRERGRVGQGWGVEGDREGGHRDGV